MVKKSDLNEIKKQFKKDTCHISRMAGVYVAFEDAVKSIKLIYSDTFLNLEDDEFYKYLEIAKKSISGTIGQNIFECKMSENSDMKKALQSLLLCELRNDELLESMAREFMDRFEYEGNYLLVFFRDAYDIPVKGSDKLTQDESDEVFNYMICAVCPVELTKPGLGYRIDGNEIATLDRDWMVGAPVNAFMYPSFSDRSEDRNTITVYTKDKKNPYGGSLCDILSCEPFITPEQKKEAFKENVAVAVEKNADAFGIEATEIKEVAANIVNKSVEISSVSEKEAGKFTEDMLADVLADNNVSQAKAQELSREILDDEAFGDTGLMMPDLSEGEGAASVTVTLPVSQKNCFSVKQENGKRILTIEVSEGTDITIDGKKQLMV